MATLLAAKLTAAGARLLPRLRTVRFRLTALYSGLFLVAGTGLLTITYLLVDHATATAVFVSRDGNSEIAAKAPAAGPSHRPVPGLRNGTPTAHQVRITRQLATQAATQHTKDLHQMLTQSGIALAVMAGLAIVCGWLMAGRALRPLRVMTATAQQISERNLYERLNLPGPADEVTELANTIDGLLARLEAAFEAQRNFVASASHELRTPLTLNRALLEVALADPAASAADFRATCQELLDAGEQQERLIEALLALASSERGLDRRDRFDLAEVAGRALAAHHADAEHRGVKVSASLGTAPAVGDPDLAERLAANLIDNAIRHNLPDGRVDVRTETQDGQSILAVANTGPAVPKDQVSRIFKPFKRVTGDRAAHPDGHGLGLAIVRAILIAHGASVKVQLPPAGGLRIKVHFPGPRPAGNARPPAARSGHSRRNAHQ